MKVHRCRFVDYVPAAINSLEFSPITSNPILAVGRQDGSIELWNPRDNWYLDRIIPGSDDQNVECLTWIHALMEVDSDDEFMQEEEKTPKYHQPRLFSAGLNGNITEWNLKTLQPKRMVDSNGGAVWCMVPNHSMTQLAVGCEDGIIRLFDVTHDGLEYSRALHKTDARILSLVWSKDDVHIYGGSSDSCIRQWHVESGRVVHRLAVDTVKGEETLVWSLKLVNTTLIAGTSLGSVHFFSTTTGTMIQTQKKAHHADVLCLAVNQKGDTVYSSGVDRRIIQYKLVDTSGSNKSKWVQSGDRRWHSHDVRALALWEEKPIDSLVTGGVDTILVLCSSLNFTNFAQRRMSCFPGPSLITVLPEKRLVLSRHSHSMTLHRLGTAKSAEMEPTTFGQTYAIDVPKQQLLEINLNDPENLTACTISRDGGWIASSTTTGIKLFLIHGIDQVNSNSFISQGPQDVIRVKRVKEFPGTKGAFALTFTPDGTRLVAAGCDRQVWVYDLTDMSVIKHFHLESDYDVALTSLAISLDGQWLAVGNLSSHIEVYQMDSLTLHYSPPRLASPFTSFSFHPSSPSTLVVTYTSNEFLLYDVEERRMSDWSQEYANKLPKRFLTSSEKIIGVGFNPARANMLTFWGTTFITFVTLTHSDSHNKSFTLNKRKREELTQDYAQGNKDDEKNPFMKIHDYQPLMLCDYTGPDEMIVVERPWFDMVARLPPSFYRPTYGT